MNQRKSFSRKLWLLVVVLFLVILFILSYTEWNGGPEIPTPAPEHAWFEVQGVVDADTLDVYLGTRVERVRLIGVDAPETGGRRGREPCGREATAFVRSLVQGKLVGLAYDWERYDSTPSRRLLAYVILEDGTFLNAEIIRQGYAHAYRKFQYRYKQDFLQYEMEAHQELRGCLPVFAPGMPRE